MSEKNEKSEREALWRRLAEHSSLNAGNAYDEMMHALEPYPSREHAEAKGSQDDLQRIAAVIIAERNLARAQAALLTAKLKLARKALDVVAIGDKESGASQIVEELRALREKEKKS
jgi:16S rRNA G1207 methylase RsmC